MSDMLGRLHARARGSDLCLHRRAHFRFAPVVGMPNEGTAGITDPLAAALDDPFSAEPGFGDADIPGEVHAAAAPRAPAVTRRRILREPRGARKTVEAGGKPPSDEAEAEIDLEAGAEPVDEPTWLAKPNPSAHAFLDGSGERDLPSRVRHVGSRARTFDGRSATSEATGRAPPARRLGPRAEIARDGVALPEATAWPGEVDGTSPGALIANEGAAAPDAWTTPQRPVEDGSPPRSGIEVSTGFAGFAAPTPLEPEIAADRPWAKVADPERPLMRDGPADRPEPASAPARGPSPLPPPPSDGRSRNRPRRSAEAPDQAVAALDASTPAERSPTGARMSRSRPGRASDLGTSTRPHTSSATSSSNIEAAFEEGSLREPDTRDDRPAPSSRPHDRMRGPARVFGRDPSDAHVPPPRAPATADPKDLPGRRAAGPDDHTAAPVPVARGASAERRRASVPMDRTALLPPSHPTDRRLVEGRRPAGETEGGSWTEARDARSAHAAPDRSPTARPSAASDGRRATLPVHASEWAAPAPADAARDPSEGTRAEAALHGRPDGSRQRRSERVPLRRFAGTDTSGATGKDGEGRIASRGAFGSANAWLPEAHCAEADAANSTRAGHAANDPQASDLASSEAGAVRTRPTPRGRARASGLAALPPRSANGRAEYGVGPPMPALVSTVTPIPVLGPEPHEHGSGRPKAEASRSATEHAAPGAAERPRMRTAGIMPVAPDGEAPADRAMTPVRKERLAVRGVDPGAAGVASLAEIPPAPTSRDLPSRRVLQPRFGPAQQAAAEPHDAAIRKIQPVADGSRPGPDMTAPAREGHGIRARAAEPPRRGESDVRPVVRDRAVDPGGAGMMRDAAIHRSEPDRLVHRRPSRPTRRDDDPAAPRALSEGKSGDLRIEIGRIEVALPKARPAPRSQPQPPAFQAKPRGGPDA